MRRIRQQPMFLSAVLLLAAMLVLSTAGSGASGEGAGSSRVLPRASVHRAVLMAQRVVFVPGSIDYTGVHDVTVALQKFVDNVDDGVILRFHKNGRYRVEGTIFVTNKSSMLFDGQNAMIFANSPGSLERSQWWITGGDNIVFRNLVVRGANPHAGVDERAYDPKREKQHGFRIEGVEGIELSHVTVSDVFGDFVYVARYVEQVATNVWIHDCTFRRNGRQGIALIATNGVIIERNIISDTRRGTFDFEPNGPNQVVSNVFVLSNTIGIGRLFFIASHGKGPVNNIVISKNKLQKRPLTIDVVPLANQRRKNWIIATNSSDTASNNRPIRFIDVDGVRVTGNKQKVTGGLPGVQLVNVCGSQVTSNDFGGGGVLKQGPNCSATLVVPVVPHISGRP